MKDKLKLNEGESLNFVRATKGPIAGEDLNEYSIVDAKGNIVGNVVHRDHSYSCGDRRTQSVCQTDAEGNVLVNRGWTGD